MQKNELLFFTYSDLQKDFFGLLEVKNSLDLRLPGEF